MKNLARLDITLHIQKCYGGQMTRLIAGEEGGDYMNKKWIHMVAFVLVVIGGVNWGLFGLFNIDLVEELFLTMPTVAEIIYVLVGIAAVYLAVTHTTDCKVCSAK